MNNSILKTNPAVFTVGDTYQIMVPVNCECIMWVKVGSRSFYDDANGTLRSHTDIHRMTVPAKLLNEEKNYTVCYRVITERRPYFTTSEDEEQISYNFYPVISNAKAYMIADAHNDSITTVNACKEFEKKYGEIDFLILAGDIPNDSGSTKNFDTIYEIADKLTVGEKPIVYAKGNHDLRGIYAEKMDDYTPIQNGNSYFSFRIGDIWGLSLDCGEDKDDSHAEYGFTVACHQFREQQTEYIKSVIERADKEYRSEGVKHKIIVTHNPFSQLLEPPFDIEKDIYSKWCSLLKCNIKPDIMISGHIHELEVNLPGGNKDHLGQPCISVVGSKPFTDDAKNLHFIGCGFIFDDEIKYVFNDDLGNFYSVK